MLLKLVNNCINIQLKKRQESVSFNFLVEHINSLYSYCAENNIDYYQIVNFVNEKLTHFDKLDKSFINSDEIEKELSIFLLKTA